jgi:hypothetical protein
MRLARAALMPASSNGGRPAAAKSVLLEGLRDQERSSSAEL